MELMRFARRIPTSLQVAGTATAIWQIAATLHLVSPLLLPGPLQIIKGFVDTLPNVLWHTVATLGRAASGFALGSILGLGFGLGMTINKRWFGVLNPIVENLRPVPAVAAIPFFILWFGTGSLGQILLTALSCAAVMAVETFHAVRAISPIVLRAALSLGASRPVLYRTVIIPSILPAITPGLRVIVALSFSITIAAELMGAQWGLGFMIMRARRTLETQTMLMCILVVGMLARTVDLLVWSCMARLTRWTESNIGSLQQL